MEGDQEEQAEETLDARRLTPDAGRQPDCAGHMTPEARSRMEPKYPFEKLEVWQLAVDLTEAVYAAARDLPRTELFVLGDQIRRASVSVALNIAEGRAADSEAEFNRFLGIALRSLIEVEACVRLGVRLGLVSVRHVDNICVVADPLEAKLRTLRARLKSPRNRSSS